MPTSLSWNTQGNPDGSRWGCRGRPQPESVAGRKAHGHGVLRRAGTAERVPLYNCRT